MRIGDKAMERSSTTGGQKGRKGRVVPYRSEDQAGPPQSLQGIEQSAGITDRDITRLKRAEREIEISHRFLQTILNSFPGNVAVVDDAGTVVITNDSWAVFGQANGLDPKLFRGGVNYLEVCRAAKGPWSEGAHETADAIEAILRGHRTYFEMEYPCHSPDRKRWYHLQAQGFAYENRRWAVLAHVDITARKQVEEQLRYQADLLSSVNDAIIASDANYRLTVWNSAAESMYGWKAGEVLGRNGLEVVQTEFPEADKARMLQSIAATGCYHGEATQVRKDGTRFPVDVGSMVLRDGQGRITGYVSVNRDITERKRIEEALRESETKFRSIFESMVAACCLDEMVYEDGKPVDYRIIDVNPSYERITGISRSAAVGAMASRLYGTGEPPFLDVCSKVAETGHPASFEAYFAPIGKYLQITSSCPGKGRFSNVFLDVTEAKKAERTMLEYQKRLRSLTSELALAEERERRRIAIGLHDDVGQSLVMTKFALQSLGETADQATAASLRGICDRIDGLIDNVRELCFELSDNILYEVGFKEAVEAYLMREIQRKCGITCRSSAKGDFSRLNHDMRAVLFRNVRELLTNVTKHAHAKNVDVRLTSGKRTLSITVSDDGIGFEPTELCDAGKEHAHFGLFSVAGQLNSLGGRLGIHSAPGRGTRILMTVPLHG